MAPATIAYSTMERSWQVWPGGGRPTLSFTVEAEAIAARDAINAGRPVPARAKAAAPADKTVFLPSRSTKPEGLDVYTAGLPGIPSWGGMANRKQPPIERPMPKTTMGTLAQSGQRAADAERSSVAGSQPAASSGDGRPRAGSNPAGARSPVRARKVKIDLEAARAAIAQHGSVHSAAIALKLPYSTLYRRLAEAARTQGTAPPRERKERVSIDIERAKALYAETKSLAKTAKALKVSPTAVNRRLCKAGVAINPKHRQGLAIDLDRALSLFKESRSFRAVAQALHVKEHRVAAALQAAGVEGRKRRDKLVDLDVAAAAAYYRDNHTLAETARHFRVGLSTVAIRFNEAGIERRQGKAKHVPRESRARSVAVLLTPVQARMLRDELDALSSWRPEKAEWMQALRDAIQVAINRAVVRETMALRQRQLGEGAHA